MSPAAIRQWQETFETEAESLVDSLIDKREFDGAKDLAEAFVTSVFPNTVGITVEREMVIKFGDLNFNANGPQNELYWRAHEAVAPYLPRSEEHTSELQSLMRISYAVFCLNKKKHN